MKWTTFRRRAQKPPLPLEAHDAQSIQGARFFVIGTQKSGTTWLRDCLNEFVPFCKPEWYLPELIENVARHVNTFGGALPADQREAMIGQLSAETWNILNAGYRGEKSAYPCSNASGPLRDAHSTAVEKTRRYFPDARIAVIVRDPRAVFNSLTHYLDHFQTGRSQGINPREFATNWAEQNLRWVRDKPDAVVRYEDLKLTFASSLTEVVSRLRIPHTTEKIAQAERAVYSVSKLRPQQPEIYRTGTIDEWRQKLDPSVAQSIFEIAAPAMAEIGYQIEG